MEVLLGLLTVETHVGLRPGAEHSLIGPATFERGYGQIYPNLKRLAADGL